MIDNIERIPLPNRAEFEERFIAQQKPVVITGLFEGEPIRSVDSVAALRDSYGDLPARLTEAYDVSILRLVESLLMGAPDFERRSRATTVESYLDHIDEHAAAQELCSEVPAREWAQVQALYELPDLVCGPDGRPKDLADEIWRAHAGFITHLHYDADHRNALLYQAFGRKRAVLVDPRYSERIRPLGVNCAFSPHGGNEEANDDFVRFVHGYQTVLEPGEALFVPAMMWHYFDYIETSMAVGLRFGKHPAAGYLSSERVAPSFHVQALAWAMAGPDPSDAVRSAYEEVRTACEETYADGSARGRAVAAVVADVYERLLREPTALSVMRPFTDALCALLDEMTYLQYSGEPVTQGPRRPVDELEQAAG